MKFAEIIREAGITPENYPKASKVDVKVYDARGKTITSPMHYGEELFANNASSKERFTDFLEDLENSVIRATSLQARISELSVDIHIHTAKVLVFSRRARE